MKIFAKMFKNKTNTAESQLQTLPGSPELLRDWNSIPAGILRQARDSQGDPGVGGAEGGGESPPRRGKLPFPSTAAAVAPSAVWH